MEFSHYLLTPDGKSGGSFRVHKNIHGAWQQNSVSAFPQTTDVDGDLKNNVAPNWFDKIVIYVLKPNTSL